MTQTTTGGTFPLIEEPLNQAREPLWDFQQRVEDALVGGTFGGIYIDVTRPAYGAVGDGVADDTVAIQAAIDAAIAIGAETVYFPDGTYKFSSTLIVGSDSAFTGVSLAGSNGLVGTTLLWAGATNTTAIYVNKGRFNHLHDFLLDNSVAKGTTIGILFSGPSTGTQTAAAQMERVTVNGFDGNVQLGDGADRDASEFTAINCNFLAGNIGFKASGSNTLNVNLYNCGNDSNATYGVSINNNVNLNVFGGAYGRNGESFHVNSGGEVFICGVRDEAGTANFRFVNAAFFLTTVEIVACSIASVQAFNKPMCFSKGGSFTIRSCNFTYGTNTTIIPWGEQTSTGDLQGAGATLRIEGCRINENSSLIQFNTSSSTAADGLTYVLKSNVKIKNDGNLNGKWPNREGKVVWPDMVDGRDDGSKTSPAYGFSSHPAFGLFYRSGTLEMSVSGIAVQQWNSGLPVYRYGLAFANGQVDAVSPDVGLRYNAAGVVEVNDGTTAEEYRDLKARVLITAEALAVRTKDGIPTDADVTVPVDGMMIVGTANQRIYVRIGGAWIGFSQLGGTTLDEIVAGSAQFAGASSIVVPLSPEQLDLNYDVYLSLTSDESYWVLDADKELDQFIIRSSNLASSARIGWALIHRGPVSAPTPPTAPSSLDAIASAYNQINLTWADNATNETGFKIERKTGAGAFAQIASVGSNVVSYSDTSVAASTAYTYRVRAYNLGGNSAYSNEDSETTPAAPVTAPAILREDAFYMLREDGGKILRE